MTLNGIDASRHQGVIDWGAVGRAGNAFAFIKATDGIRYAYTNWYHQNAAGVRAAFWWDEETQQWRPMVLGAYHFLLDHHPGDAQARYYVQTVGDFHGVVPIVDIEREQDGTTPRIQHLRAFVHEFRRLVPGRSILVYTGRWYWVGVIGDPFGADLGPLWHSEYDGLTPIDFEVADGPELDTYGGWRDCLVWQYTSSGRVPGVAGNCDRNLFYGTRQQLEVLAGIFTEEDSLSADEVRKINEHTTAEANRVIEEIRSTLPYFACDYERAEQLGEDIVWLVSTRNGSLAKEVVPQPGDTPEEQEAPGKAILFDLLNDEDASQPNPVCNGTWPNNGYPRAWDRRKAYLDQLRTVGPVPPGWETPAAEPAG